MARLPIDLSLFDAIAANDASGHTLLEILSRIDLNVQDLYGAGTLTGRKEFNVLDYGANPGNSSVDNTTAFQNCINAARAVHGTVVVPPPNDGFYYRINSTLNIQPISGQAQIWINMIGAGRAGSIMYHGANNTNLFNILGLKGGRFVGINAGIATGRTGCCVWNIDTSVEAPSTSFVTFSDMYLNLGGSSGGATAADRNEDCIGIRTGLLSAGSSGDISNYEFFNIRVFGGGNRFVSPNVPCVGQYAYQNLGGNTLSMVWRGGFVADCDRAYTNVNRAGTQRGNGCANFYGMGGSANNLDFMIAYEQAYIISGGRWEIGNRFLQTTDNNAAYSSIKVEQTTIHAYKQEPIIDVTTACSLSLSGVFINKGVTLQPNYTTCVRIGSSTGRRGSLRIVDCGFQLGSGVALPYTKVGGDTWKRTCSQNVRNDGDYTTGYFDDETNNSA